MYLIYFDENKYSEESPYFFIGGILLEDTKLNELEKYIMQIQYDFFGTNILTKETELHGIDIFHGKKNCKNIKLDTRINLMKDIVKFLTTNEIPIRLACIDVAAHNIRYNNPQPEYNLGLMLILERFCDYLDNVTHSHHSRFLQIADIVVYLANRFEHQQIQPTKWHEMEAKKLWIDLKQNTDFYIKRWPTNTESRFGTKSGATSLN